MTKLIFWGSVGALVHTHLTYPLALAALERLRGAEPPPPAAPPDGDPPRVSLIVAAFDEEEVIAEKVANALALDYPRERLELIVASDGSSDRTVELAREAGADLILDLPRGGKMATQNAAVEQAAGEIVAFSDANSSWEQGALRALAAAFADPEVGYASGQVTLRRSRRRQRGGGLLALRDGGARARVAARPGSPPATAASTRSAAPPTATSSPRAATTSRFPSCCGRTGGAPSTSRRRGRPRRWCRRSRASSPASAG